jgi:putative transposase
MPRLKGFRFPRGIVALAVWGDYRFALSTVDVEDLLAERGVIVSREAIRLWVNRFGAHFAACIRRDRPRLSHKWHLDEVVIQMGGVKHWLWRAVDDEEGPDSIREIKSPTNGDTLDILVQTRRNAKAAKRFLMRLIALFGLPRVVTDRRGRREKSWGGSSPPDRHSASLPRMTRSTRHSNPAAIASPLHPPCPGRRIRSVDELCSPDEAMTWQTRGIAASTKQLGNAVRGDPRGCA